MEYLYLSGGALLCFVFFWLGFWFQQTTDENAKAFTILMMIASGLVSIAGLIRFIVEATKLF